MNNDNNHIKNFFIFLKEKENRDIPKLQKIIFFPETVTHSYIKRNLSAHELIKYLNSIQNNFDVRWVGGFDSFAWDITLVQIANFHRGNFLFMNIQGQLDVRGIDLSELIIKEHIGAYFNSILNDYYIRHHEFFSTAYPTKLVSPNKEKLYVVIPDTIRNQSFFMTQTGKIKMPIMDNNTANIQDLETYRSTKEFISQTLKEG